jgi:Flp pilus assembly pilin Flp
MGSFLSEESGQDLIEYSLLLAFVGLIAVAFFSGISQSVNAVWDEGSEVLVTARQRARGH